MTVVYRHTDGRRVTRPEPEPMLEASPRWTRVASSDPDAGFPCAECDFVGKTAGGLMFHRNAKHKKED